ncbi:MAG: class I SAM-dependent methyltransferase [Gemmatimonadota bacterium]
MDPRLQLRVQRYGWDRAAAHYEAGWAWQLRPSQKRLLEMAALEPGESVLELACGTGLVTLPVTETVGPGGRVVATDLSEAMVDHVRTEAARRGLSHLEVERADAGTLPYDDASFHVVLCSLGLMYVPDVPPVLEGAFRVLRPGGRMVVSVWGERSACGWADIFPIVDSRVNTEVCPLFFQLGTGGSLELNLEQAGFREIEADRLDVSLEYASDEEALGAAFLGGPVAMAYSRFDAETAAEARAEYLASIEEYREEGTEGYRIPGRFVVVRGRKE